MLVNAAFHAREASRDESERAAVTSRTSVDIIARLASFSKRKSAGPKKGAGALRLSSGINRPVRVLLVSSGCALRFEAVSSNAIAWSYDVPDAATLRGLRERGGR